MKEVAERLIIEYGDVVSNCGILVDTAKNITNVSKAYLSLTSELERVKRQLGVAVEALEFIVHPDTVITVLRAEDALMKIAALDTSEGKE